MSAYVQLPMLSHKLDHIVPKSEIFETGYANLVLCRKELNKLKNRKLASDFVKSDLGFTEEKWKEVAEKFKLQKKIKCQIHTTSTSQEKRMSI